jgi:hypothetical protein
MQTRSFIADWIEYLKGLHVRWTTELEHVVSVDPERALHLAEALDDLKRMIGDLEIECSTKPRNSDALRIARHDDFPLYR